jgi:hypothetical protein
MAVYGIKYVNRNLQEALQKRLKLDDKLFLPEATLFLPTIQPMTSVDELLKTPKIYSAVKAYTANAAYLAHTVPEGKRWHLRIAEAAISSGTAAIANLYISDGVVLCGLDPYGASVQDYVWMATSDLIMNEGWWLSVVIMGFAGAGNVTVNVVIEEEDAY